MQPKLEVRNVNVELDGKKILQRVSLTLAPGQIASIVGPSGCGKTTLLRAIAGFHPVSNGEIIIHQRRVGKAGFTVAPEDRHVGMMFQDLALFPHLTVEQNIRFGLKKLPRDRQRTRIRQVLDLVGLNSHAKKHPHLLSGGQQQRIALARSLAPGPEILLLDEPFSDLDPNLREQVATEVGKILKHENVTAILVTHNQDEAFALADEIGVMQDGQIVQWGDAYQVYHRPKTRFVADFIGLGSTIPARVIDSTTLDTEFGRVTGELCPSSVQDSDVDLLLRPDNVLYDDGSKVTALIEEKHFRGTEFLYRLRLPSGNTLLCYAPTHHTHQIGARIGIRIDLRYLMIFPRN